MVKSDAMAHQIASEFLGNSVHAGPRSAAGEVAAGQIGPEGVIGDDTRGGEGRGALLISRIFRVN